MPTPDWQILIASVWARTGLLLPLLEHLSAQTAEHQGRVEVLVDRDNGDKPVGVKRTRLLEHATADYVSFVDDDDWVSDDYVHRVTLALTDHPDAVGFRLAYTRDGVPQKPAVHSALFTQWAETPDCYQRTINHLNPVRRQLALLGAPFQDGFGEDHAYATRIAPRLRTEVFLDGEPVYEYRYSRAGSLFACGNRTVTVDPGLEVPAHVHLLSHHEAAHG